MLGLKSLGEISASFKTKVPKLLLYKQMALHQPAHQHLALCTLSHTLLVYLGTVQKKKMASLEVSSNASMIRYIFHFSSTSLCYCGFNIKMVKSQSCRIFNWLRCPRQSLRAGSTQVLVFRSSYK